MKDSLLEEAQGLKHEIESMERVLRLFSAKEEIQNGRGGKKVHDKYSPEMIRKDSIGLAKQYGHRPDLLRVEEYPFKYLTDEEFESIKTLAKCLLEEKLSTLKAKYEGL